MQCLPNTNYNEVSAFQLVGTTHFTCYSFHKMQTFYLEIIMYYCRTVFLQLSTPSLVFCCIRKQMKRGWLVILYSLESVACTDSSQVIFGCLETNSQGKKTTVFFIYQVNFEYSVYLRDAFHSVLYAAYEQTLEANSSQSTAHTAVAVCADTNVADNQHYRPLHWSCP